MIDQLTVLPTDKQLLVVLENAGNSTIAASMSEYVSQGKLLTTAFLMAMTKKHGPAMTKEGVPVGPTLEELDNQEIAKKLWESYSSQWTGFSDTYIKHQFETVDRVIEQYPGRIIILSEGGNQDNLIGRVGEKILRARDLTGDGRFHEALIPFKEGVEIMAQSTTERERLVIDKVTDIITQNPNIASVVLSYGIAHTSLMHGLRRKGLTTHYRIVENLYENKPYLFDPESIMERRRILFPEVNIPELEWLQALIGDYLYTLFYQGPEDFEGILSAQEISHVVYTTVKTNLNKIEIITQFGQKVQEASRQSEQNWFFYIATEQLPEINTLIAHIATHL